MKESIGVFPRLRADLCNTLHVFTLMEIVHSLRPLFQSRNSAVRAVYNTWYMHVQQALPVKVMRI